MFDSNLWLKAVSQLKIGDLLNSISIFKKIKTYKKHIIDKKKQFFFLKVMLSSSLFDIILDDNKVRKTKLNKRAIDW